MLTFFRIELIAFEPSCTAARVSPSRRAVLRDDEAAAGPGVKDRSRKHRGEYAIQGNPSQAEEFKTRSKSRPAPDHTGLKEQSSWCAEFPA